MPSSIEVKVVADYTGCSFDVVYTMGLFQYWQFLRDAVIFNNMQTPEGNEYLANCERIEDTQPDRVGLRRIKGD